MREATLGSGRTALLIVFLGLPVAYNVGPLLPRANHANQLSVEIIQGVCEGSGKDAPVQGAVAKVSGTTEWSQKTGTNGKTAISLPPKVTSGMTETIVVLRGDESLDVVLPRNGNLVIPDLNDPKSVKLVVQAKGSTSGLCSIEVQEPLTKRALASSLVQSTVDDASGKTTVSITPDDLSRLAREFKSPSFDQFPIGLLALEIADWQRAAEAFDSSLTYRMGQYLNDGGSKSRIADAAYLSGYSHFQLKQYAVAADAFRESDTYQPNMFLTLASYAISLGEAGQEADEVYLRALELAPANDPASGLFRARLLHDFGVYLNNQEKYGEAKQRLEEAVALLKDLPDQEAELANDYLELAYTFQKMPTTPGDILPRNPQIENYLRLAVQLLQSAQPEKLAIAKYRLAAHLTEDYDDSNRESHYPEAENLFRTACPLLPNNDGDLDRPACVASYAELLRYKGDCIGAEQELQSVAGELDAIAAQPYGRAIAEKIGIILQDCGKH